AALTGAPGAQHPPRPDRAVGELAPVPDDGGRARPRLGELDAALARRAGLPRAAVRSGRALVGGGNWPTRRGASPDRPRPNARRLPPRHELSSGLPPPGA